MHPYALQEGSAPLILSMPHTGTFLPATCLENLTEEGLKQADTDWFIDRLYEGLLPDVTIIRANYHRYYLDLNRPLSEESLYPTQNTTGLFPETSFTGTPLYNTLLSPQEKQRRIEKVYLPYHQEISHQINRLKQKFPDILLFDCHSIASTLPFLFDGTLPHFNLGTYNGQSCSPAVESCFNHSCQEAANSLHFHSVLNGRFKGGWITRHYGAPTQGVHALQLELAQRVYMDEATCTYCPDKAKALRPFLQKTLQHLIQNLPQNLINT